MKSIAVESWGNNGAVKAGCKAMGIEMLVDSLPAIVWITDPNGTVIFVNRYTLEYLRFPELDLLGLDFPQARTNASSRPVAEPWREAKDETFESETTITDRDGVPRHFLTRFRPLRDAVGRLEGFIGFSLPLESDRAEALEAIPHPEPFPPTPPIPLNLEPSRTPGWSGEMLSRLLGDWAAPKRFRS